MLEYIDELPYDCRLNEAILNDPQRAEEIARLPEPTEPWSPKVSEYNLDKVMLREIMAKLDGVQQAVIASVGGKPKHTKPFPVPRTAMDKAKEKVDKEYGRKIIGMLGFDEDEI